MKKIRVLQITAIIVVASALSGMYLFTSVYEEVQSRIVKVLCLSCSKLEPKTELGFAFETANGEPHPPFVLQNLSHGLVFLHFSEDVCHACDIIFPTVQETFNLSFEKKQAFAERIKVQGVNLTFIYINIDHRAKHMSDSLHIYDKDHIGGLPMFSLITLGYDHGFVKPYYTSLYGLLNLDTPEERKALFDEIVFDGVELYNQNKAGYTQQ